MAKPNNKDFVEFLQSKKGTPYVYGMKGKVLTKEKYDWLYKTYGPKNVWPSDAQKIGKVCVDCSGLATWFTGIEKSSSGFRSEVPASCRHSMADINAAPVGAAVWYDGHIGFYIGRNTVIEARGSAYGVVETYVYDRPWKEWFELVEIEYLTDSYYIITGPYPTEQDARKEAGDNGKVVRVDA